MSKPSVEHASVSPEQFRSLAWCIVAFAAVMTVGTVGFCITEENWTTWDALFFTLITVTTVGYGDENISVTGERFAAIMLIVGIGTATFTFSSLIQVAVGCQLAWKAKMQKRINHLHDHVIVCGFGRMGKYVCEQLREGSVPIVVIEHTEAGYLAAIEMDYLAVHGCATEDKTLLEAGVEQARGVICVVDSDAENIVITLSARELNKDLFIASRADGEAVAHKIERAGASLVVSPHITAGHNIATAILHPHLAELMRHAQQHVSCFEMSEVPVGEGSPLDGMTAEEYGSSEENIVFVGVKKSDGELRLRPRGNTQFVAGDVVIVAGPTEDLARMHHQGRSKGKRKPQQPANELLPPLDMPAATAGVPV